MVVKFIQAKFECDGCGKDFAADIDPAASVGNHKTAFDLAEDWLREDFAISIQDGMHLCVKCTLVADKIGPEDGEYQPTSDEIKRALGAIS